MEPSARTIDEFVAHIKQNGLQFALITPTSGFLGSHLVEALLAQNIAVLCEVAANSKAHNYTKHLTNNQNFFLLEHSHQQGLPINLPPPKYIIYDVQETLNHFAPADDISFSLSIEAKRLLEYAVFSRATFLLLAGTDPDLQNPYELPKPQEHTLSLNTKEHQAQLKHFVKTLMTEAIHKSGLNARVVLYADVYGPRMDLENNSFIAQAVKSVLLHDPITITGDGLSILRPLYITDFIYGVLKSLLVGNTQSKTYTLVNPKEITLLNFATELQKVSHSYGISVDISFTNEPSSNSFAQRPIFDALSMQELFWNPKVELTDGLTRTLGFFFPPQPPQKMSDARTTSPEQPTIHTEARKAAVGIAIQKAPTEEIVPYHKAQAMEKLKKPLSFLRKEGADEKPATTSKASSPLLSKKDTKKRNPVLKFLALILILLGLLVLSPLATFTLLKSQTQKSTVGALQESATDKQILNAITLTSLTKSTSQIASIPFRILGKNNTLLPNSTALSAIDNTLQGKIALVDAYGQLDRLLALSETDFSETMRDARLHVQRAKTHTSLAKAEHKLLTMQREKDSRLTSDFSAQLKETDKLVRTQEKDLGRLSTLLPFINMLFEQGKERTFALLLVDNTELRPSGGTVTALFTVTLKPGKKPALTSYDLGSAALNPKQAAPEDMKTYLRQSNMLLENMLWDYDFERSTQALVPNIAQFIGKPVDGVISLDFVALKSLLGLTKKITLSTSVTQNGEKLIFSQENFDTQLAKLYESTTLPNGERRTALLRELVEKALEEVALPKVSFKQFEHLSAQMLRERHMNLFLADNTLKNSLHGAWIPSIDQTPTDFISLAEANISLNKVNPYITRTIHHNIVLNTSGEVAERIVVTYKNESPSDKWPLGNYQAYTKIVLPKDQKVQRVTVDNKKPTTPIDTVEEGTRKTVGAAITVPPKATVVLAVELQRAKLVTIVNGKATLKITVFKQSGTVQDPYELAVQFPSEFTVASTSVPFEKFDDGILTKTVLDTSKTFEVVLGRQ